MIHIFEIKNKLGSDNMMHYLGELMLFKEKVDYRLSKLITEFKQSPPTIKLNDCSATISHIIHNFINEIEKYIKKDSNNFSQTINTIEYKCLDFRRYSINETTSSNRKYKIKCK